MLKQFFHQILHCVVNGIQLCFLIYILFLVLMDGHLLTRKRSWKRCLSMNSEDVTTGLFPWVFSTRSQLGKRFSVTWCGATSGKEGGRDGGAEIEPIVGGVETSRDERRWMEDFVFTRRWRFLSTNFREQFYNYTDQTNIVGINAISRSRGGGNTS